MSPHMTFTSGTGYVFLGERHQHNLLAKEQGLMRDLLSEYSCLLQMNQVKIDTALRQKKKGTREFYMVTHMA